MAVNDTAIGSALIIPEDLLKSLDKVDEKIKRIQDTSQQTAQIFNSSFASMSGNTSGLLTALQQVINQLGGIGKAAQTASSATQNMGSGLGTAAQGATNIGASVTQVTEYINRMAGSVQQVGNAGKVVQSTSVEAAKAAKELARINLIDQQTATSKEKANVELAKQARLQAQAATEAAKLARAQAQLAQAQAMAATATERANAANARAANRATISQYSQSASSALGYANNSANVSTYNQRATAIKVLEQAMKNLNSTEADYQKNLSSLSSRYRELKAAQDKLVGSYRQIQTHHRNLMDTAGQLQRAFALVFSVSQIRGYIETIAKVRGEFELQQRSLEAILQNKTEADTIFNKTVALAVQSPFQIKELVSYTKELAAYRIESDKLYDTTKRLADVSAGLGVDMSRLILAYGQVKAAAYLRGSEVRQFTEAGINMYGELQALFKERDQADYTTAQIVDMISKRQVTFEDVEEVFQRITDQGGIFYRMQEIQAETLQGKIANFRDSVDVMMNEIGKNNEGLFKGAIDSATALMDNWETVADVGRVLAEVIVSMTVSYKILNGAFGTAAQNAMTQAKHFGVLKGLMTTLSGQATKLGASLKAAFVGSLPLVGLTAAIELFGHLINVQREYYKAQKEADNKYYKGQVRVSEIERLSVTVDENTSKPKIREALNALVKEMNNEGFNIEIKVNLSEEEAKQEYDKLLKQHKQYLDDMLRLDYQYNLDKKNNSWLWQTDADEADESITESYAKALVTITQIQTELARVADKGIGLNDAMIKELKTLELGVTESGSLKAIQDYYKSLSDFLEKIRKTDIYTGAVAGDITTVSNTFAGISSSVLEGVRVLNKDLDKAKIQMEEKIKFVFDSIFNFKNYDNSVKVAMATSFATARGWSLDMVQQIMSPLYDIDFTKVPKNNEDDFGTGTNDKLQRDILAERISLIKELNQEYEKLNKVMGSDRAAKTVMERYASSLEDVQMPKDIIGDAFVPNKANTAKALQDIAQTVDDFKKKIGAEKDAWKLLDSDDVDNVNKQIDETKKNIDAMFAGLDLHQKLKDAGLTEEEVKQLFPGLAKSLDDVQKGIEETYKMNFPKGEYLTPGTTANEKYMADMDSLNQKRVKEQQDLAVRLLNEYKTQLSDQLQLDLWYAEERNNIEKAFADNPERKKQLTENLTTKYNQQTDENTWKQFQNSDFYINLFANLDESSTYALKYMREQLELLKESLKSLPPDMLKPIIEQMEKLDDIIANRNPFIAFAKSIKDVRKNRDEYKAALEEFQVAKDEKSTAQQEYDEAKQREQVLKVSVDYGELSADSEEYKNAIEATARAQEKLKEATEKCNKAEQKVITTHNKISMSYHQIASALQAMGSVVTGLGSDASDLASVFSDDVADGIDKAMGVLDSMVNAASNVLNVIGEVSDNVVSTIQETAESTGQAVQASSKTAATAISTVEKASVILAIISAALKVATAIANLFNNDKKLQKEIERQQEIVESLQHAYEKLKKSMEDAWSAADVIKANENTKENIEAQIEAYQKMIAAEKDKKKRDDGQIAEWERTIMDLQDELVELEETTKEAFGGFGSDENYKSAAQEFADAWIDAFNESEDTLEALEDTFDDYFNNMLKKQLMQRAANEYLQPIFDAFDKAVSEGSAGGYEGREITDDEIAKIQELKDSQLEAFDEYAQALMEVLGVKPSGSSSSLSQLQQGIESLSESTGQALESLLNSIRFFVAQQTTDVSAIRALLQQSSSIDVSTSTDTPMLTELRSQTGYLREIRDTLNNVVKRSGHPKQGAGIKVFLD